jgi:hypothetical protein
MHLRTIPFYTVALDVASIRERAASSHSSLRSLRFSTAHHNLTEITKTIPETKDIKHELPPWRPYLYTLWLPLIAKSQKITDSHVFTIPSFLYEELMRIHSQWVGTGTISEENGVLNETVEAWMSLKSESARGLKNCFDGKRKWFIRLDQMSPKDSPIGGNDPTTTLKGAVIKLCSSMRAYGALLQEKEAADKEDRDLVLKLVLNPWNWEMDAGTEFRVFVPPPNVRGAEAKLENLKISAISQYRWSMIFKPVKGMSTQQVAELVTEGANRVLKEVIEHARDELKPEILELLLKYGLSFDVALHGTNEIQLIEINPFGALSGCGACLFNWELDARVLYGLEEDMTFIVTQETWNCVVLRTLDTALTTAEGYRKLLQSYMTWARLRVALYLKKWLPSSRKGRDEFDSDVGSEYDSESVPGSADFVQKMKKRYMKNR